jgi:hypothetical protein
MATWHQLKPAQGGALFGGVTALEGRYSNNIRGDSCIALLPKPWFITKCLACAAGFCGAFGDLPGRSCLAQAAGENALFFRILSGWLPLRTRQD